MFRLEHWSVHTDDNPYTPPENRNTYICGYVYGNPKFKDGDRVTTSRIIKSEGRVVSTYGGSQYELGTVSVDYAKYLKDNNRTLDETNPIKVVKLDDDSSYNAPSNF